MAKSNVVKMSEAVGEVRRISPTMCVDSVGNKIKTHGKAQNPGAGQGQGGGQPRAFNTPDDLLDSFDDFLNYVRLTDFEVYPTKANFSRYMEIDAKTVYNTVEKYFPEIKKRYIDMLSDCLTEGASIGKYDKTMTIFCLKNWCNWADKTDNVNTEIRPTLTDKATADKLIKEYADRHK